MKKLRINHEFFLKILFLPLNLNEHLKVLRKLWYDEIWINIHKLQIGVLLLNYLNLLGLIGFRFIFFVLNLNFAIQVTSASGWNFFSILLAFFATREFVGAIQMCQFFYHLKKTSEKKQNKKNQSNQ